MKKGRVINTWEIKPFVCDCTYSSNFVLLTLWENAIDNEVYNIRKKAWGKSFKTIYED